jgi:hypothetical protein
MSPFGKAAMKTEWTRRMSRYLACAVLLATSGLAATQEVSEFRHDFPDATKPWGHENFDAADDKFTFAVFSDLTGGERPGIFSIAVEQLSLLRPELILNVGDLIEGGTEDLNEIDEQRKSFEERASRANAPVFYVGGNHDLTGDVLQRSWEERYGRRYYHFVYKEVLFLVLDTEDNTSERTQQLQKIRDEAISVFEFEGRAAFLETDYVKSPEQRAGNVTQEQSNYFLNVLADNPDVRWTFLFMHKAPWLRGDLEPFAAIEAALADRSYTVFHGHLHAYRYAERLGRDYIQLGTTGGVHLPDAQGRAVDHVTLVTVDDSGVDIANLLMSGILDKSGHVPLESDGVCFETAVCGGDDER